MLRFLAHPGRRFPDCSRREWLRLGGLGGLSLLARPVPSAAASERNSDHPPGFGRARSVIVVFASGGQSHIDLWDPKPQAPAEVRGAFSSIETSVPGVRLCEHVPRIARVLDRCTLLRCLSHEDLDHGSAVHLALTGRYHPRRSSNPPASPNDQPCYSAVLQRVRPSREFVHTAVHVNGPNFVPHEPAPGQYGGLLGKRYDAFTVGDVSTGDLAAPGLSPQAELPPVRLDRRERLLTALDHWRGEINGSSASPAAEKDVLYEQAFDVLSQPQTREAFRLSAEPERLRERYGRHRSGQACLLARRLVEAGVPLVTVFWNHNNRGQDKAFGEIDEWGWDTHNDIFFGLKQQLLPRFDQSFSALLEDLDDRGLLDETLVVCMGEFGRAPLVALERNFAGESPGRKHWANAYSAVFAGAGVMRGGVVGATDAQGGYPVGDRYGPWDVIATIFAALGIDPASHYTTPQGQQMKVCDGEPIAALYG